MRSILSGLFLVFALLLPGIAWAGLPRAEHGVIDLREVDFAQVGGIDLTGEWGLVLGSDASRAFSWQMDAYLEQPGPWNRHYPDSSNVSLVLRVLLPEDAPPLALAVPDVNSAWRLHVDGVLVRSMGELGLDVESEIPVLERTQVPLPSGRSFLDLVFEVSNHHHFESGMVRPVRLGGAARLAVEAERLTALPLAAFGALVMVTLLALAFYAGGQRDPVLLMLALFTAMVAARTCATAQLYVLVGHEIRADHFYMPVGYATSFVFPGLYFGFLRALLPDETPRQLAWGGAGLAAVMLALILFTPPTFYTGFRDVFMVLNLLAPLIGTVLLGRAILRHRIGAPWLLVGSLLFTASLLNDILHYARFIYGTDLVPLGLTAFTVCYFAALALRTFQAERSASERLGVLNRDLEGLVAARTASLAEALEVAERASRAKSEFLAVMSHEIRTPLHGWAGLTELLAQTTLDAQQHKYVKLLRHTAEQLARLIGNILELAGMETGRLQLAPEPLRLDELAAELAAVVQGLASDRGQGFAFDCAADLPEGLVADESAVLQLLHTLLDRFGSGSGDMALGLSVTAGQLLIALNGPGREDVESSGEADIGQSLCQNLVEAMGGTLALWRQGRRLWAEVRLPLTETLAPAPRHVGLPTHVAVLLADDVELNRLVLHGFLTAVGWSVDEAADGRQAVSKAKAKAYDLIILDLRMPVMDGFAAARAIQADEKAAGRRPVPLVALSAGATSADRQRAAEAGFVSFIAKPVGAELLVATLSALLPAEVMPLPPAPAPAPVPPAGLEGLMPTFLAEMDKDAARLQELQGGDRDSLIEHVHAMRGKCGMFGENVLYEILSALERDAATAAPAEIFQQVTLTVERVKQLRQYQ